MKFIYELVIVGRVVNKFRSELSLVFFIFIIIKIAYAYYLVLAKWDCR